jgi:glycosidase
MTNELLRISGQCDGVRCDMAMLILPEVFERTWGRRAQPFWPVAIKTIHEKAQDFIFMAEVYWDMEWDLQQLGFDYAYDKRLYDRLCEGNARSVREHFYAGLDYQDKLTRFLENHDEPRAAFTFGSDKHKAAAVITYLSPGLRFFHQGQFEGRKKRISPHLVRSPKEPVDENLQTFYWAFLDLLKKTVFRNGTWRLLECSRSWHDNETWDSFLSFSWVGTDGEQVLVIVNFAPHAGQCFVKLSFSGLENQQVEISDKMSEAVYVRDGNDLISNGLFVDIPAWGYHIFEVFVPLKKKS